MLERGNKYNYGEIRRVTNNAMAKRKRTKEQIYKTFPRKL